MRLTGGNPGCFLLLTVSLTLPTVAAETLTVTPTQVELDSPEARQQLLVTGVDATFPRDLTRQAVYTSAAPAIASVNSAGQIVPQSEGDTEILVSWENQTLKVPVRVRHLVSPRPVSFRNEVIPILSKAGCNAGGCHGKAEGQNGFKLSIFGFDAEADHHALVKEARGRRVVVAAPLHSLLLRKATGDLPHGGGRKIAPDGLRFRRLSRWIREGARLEDVGSAPITGIEVLPKQIVMRPSTRQQLQVTAIDQDGQRWCVTAEADFQSNADVIAKASSDGLISVSDVPGEAAVLVRYMGHVAVCRVTLPRTGQSIARPPEHNFIDHHVWNKLQQLGIPASDLADDATFLRRVYLDTIGTLPTSTEARSFLQDTVPDKRARLIDQLLQRDEYADYQAIRWADILRVDQAIVSPQGAVAMTRWLREQFRENTPYDHMVREVVTAKGSTLREGPAAFFQVHKEPEMLARSVSQVFLGVRIECAQCHHHPFERWSQQDYFALAGFFTGVKRNKLTSGGIKLTTQAGTDLKHPRTSELVPATALGAPPPDLTSFTDRREALADWMTTPENPYLAKMIANRLWSHYFGRGVVEPIDDMRATNPASNEPLMEALAAHVIESRFDLQEFTRTLLNSRTYQLASQTRSANETDSQNFSHATWKLLSAEVLLDAISQVTGVPETFNGWPVGSRAIHIWDNRMPSEFFRIFGRPQRVSSCECERGVEPSIAQALHLMNSPQLIQKIAHRDGHAISLANSDRTPKQIIEELYLSTVSRFPTAAEVQLMLHAFEEAETTRRTATEDVMWALLNSKEFLFRR